MSGASSADPHGGPDGAAAWRRELGELSEAALRRWRWTLAGVLLTVHGTVLAALLIAPRDPMISPDFALYEHAGWSITQGRVPYVDIWDVKPPLAQEVPALFALVSGSNMALLHGISVAASIAASVGALLVAAQLVHEQTGSRRAALVTGLFPLVFAPWTVQMLGFQSKAFVLLLGLGAVLLQDRGRAGLAGAASAAAAGFWQPALVFPLLVLGRAILQRRGVADALAGMVAVTVAVVAPIVLAGGGVAMLVEVVLVTLLVGEPSPGFLVRGGRLVLLLRYALVPLAVGLGGLLVAWDRRRELAWLLALAAWTGLVLFADFDGPPDLLLGVLVAGVGFGLLWDRCAAGSRRALTAVLGAGLFVSVVGAGGLGVVFDPVTEEPEDQRADPALVHAWMQSLHGASGEGEPGNRTVSPVLQPVERSSFYGGDRMPGIYWNKVLPEPCHYRLSRIEIVWMEKTNRTFLDEPCGEWPSEVL